MYCDKGNTLSCRRYGSMTWTNLYGFTQVIFQLIYIKVHINTVKFMLDQPGIWCMCLSWMLPQKYAQNYIFMPIVANKAYARQVMFRVQAIMSEQSEQHWWHLHYSTFSACVHKAVCWKPHRFVTETATVVWWKQCRPHSKVLRGRR